MNQALSSSSNGLEKRPKLRFPGFDEPWKATAFGDLVHEFSDRTKEEDEDTLLSAAIEGMFLNTELFGHQRGASNKGYKKIKYGTMVLSTQNLHLGNANVNQRFEHGMVSPAYKTYDITGCSVDLIAQWIKSEAAKRFFYNATTVGASVCRRNVEWDTLYEQPLYLPCLDEQEKVAKFLALLSDRINKQQQYVSALKKYKRGLISEILKQKIVITHESEIWEEVSLSEVADGFEYGMNAAATSYDGEHKYIRITDIDDDSHTYIDRDPVSPSGVLEEKYRVREDDILFARTGASVGKSYLYQKTDGDLFFAGFLIRIHVKEGVDSEYVFLNTLTEEYDKWVLLESARSGQPGINAEQYRQYRFKLPSLRTQKRIAAIARKFDAQIQKEIKCLCLHQEQRHGLLQQLFI